MVPNKLWISSLFLILLCACSSSTEPDGERNLDIYHGEYMFQEGTSLQITANKTSFDLMEPVELTFVCYPEYSGVGHLDVQFLPEKQSAWYKGILVDTPETEQSEGYLYREKVRFEAGKPLRASWTIRVQDESKHFLYGFAEFDSVCADDANCLQIGSEEALELYGLLDSRPAQNYPGYELSEPVE